jgi:hypothetical protein
MQGYLFAKPTFESLPEITWPDDLKRNTVAIDSVDLSPTPPGLSSVA